MDLTNYDVNTVGEGRGQVEPGRHVLHWQGEEEALIEGKNGWRGCKMYFEVGDSGIRISHVFSVAHNNAAVVDKGIKSMLLMAQAMGIKEPPKDTSTAFMGKSVSAELIKGDTGYLEIDEKFGETWQSTNAKPKVVSEKPIQAGPSEADLAAVGSTTDDEAPF
jgi:hypothetical protein